MNTIQLHYDGWLSLPADARQSLGVATGDRLEAEFVDGALVLRPVRPGKMPTRAVPENAGAPADDAAADDAPVVKRGPGRPRKLAGPGLVPNIKVGGRRKTVPSLSSTS